MKLKASKTSRTSGFTLMEIVIATSIAMILLFGALYSTSETLEVVREGDIKMNTNINVRRALDRILKDCRYAEEVEVSGDAATGWTVEVETTGALSPGELEYTWNPNSELLMVAVSGGNPETMIQGVSSMSIATLSEIINGESEITRITFNLTVSLDASAIGGMTTANPDRKLELGGATWIRRHDI
ncbi:MAG: hypothetical protein QGF46_05530 [Planctomycetota bacterium]|nr:hypothetical protein [Planctomycetota bacterium]